MTELCRCHPVILGLLFATSIAFIIYHKNSNNIGEAKNLCLQCRSKYTQQIRICLRNDDVQHTTHQLIN